MDDNSYGHENYARLGQPSPKEKMRSMSAHTIHESGRQSFISLFTLSPSRGYAQALREAKNVIEAQQVLINQSPATPEVIQTSERVWVFLSDLDDLFMKVGTK